MYHKASISPLSSTQISKILNGHSVRVSAGNGHDIELSKEQFKKLAKAQKTGKGMTLTMDPFQMQNHQYLRGSGNVKKTAKGSAKRLIVSATDRLIRSIEGGTIFFKTGGNDGINNKKERDDAKYTNAEATHDAQQMYGYGIGGNIKAVAKDSGKRLIVSGTDRAIRAIDGSGFGNIKQSFLSGTDSSLHAMTGTSVNRLKKGQRWESFANATLRDGIDTAGKAARVYYDSTNPIAQMGFGLKKRKAHRRKRSISDERRRGGALYPAEIP